MKTPIQEFYDFMEQQQYFIGNDLYKKYKELINKEKKFIKSLYNRNISSIDLCMQQQFEEDWAEDYYNETFKNK